jgi:hypothetical protein
MNAKEILEAIKNKVNEHFGTVENFTEAKLADGITIVSWDGELVQGNVLYVIGEEGRVPAPIGEHTFEDGTVVVVGNAEGMIQEVILPQAVEETPVTEEQSQVNEPTVEVKVPKRVIKSIVEEQQFHLEIEDVEPITVDLSPLFSQMKEMRDELKKEKEFNKEVFALVTKLADEPVQERTESTTASKRITKKEIKEIFNNFKK